MPPPPVWITDLRGEASRWGPPFPGWPAPGDPAQDPGREGLLQEGTVEGVALGEGFLVVRTERALSLWDLDGSQVWARAEVPGTCLSLGIGRDGARVVALLEDPTRRLLDWRPRRGEVTWREALGAHLTPRGDLLWVDEHGVFRRERDGAVDLELGLSGAQALRHRARASLTPGPGGLLGVLTGAGVVRSPRAGFAAFDLVDLDAGRCVESDTRCPDLNRAVFLDPLPRIPTEVPGRLPPRWPPGWVGATMWSDLTSGAEGRCSAHFAPHPRSCIVVRAEGAERHLPVEGYGGYPWGTRLSFSPRGDRLAVSLRDRVFVVDPVDFDPQLVRGEGGTQRPAIRWASWGRGGTLALASSQDLVVIADGQIQKRRRTTGGGEPWGLGVVEDVVWLGAGRLAHRITGRGRGRRVQLVSSSRPPKLAVLAPDGSRAAIRRGKPGEHRVEVREASTGTLLHDLATPRPPAALHFTADGRWLLAPCGDGEERRWLAWDLAARAPNAEELPLPPGAVGQASTTRGLVFESPGVHLGVLHLDDKQVRSWRHPGPRITAAGVTPGGRYLVLAHADLQLRCLDTRTGTSRSAPLGRWLATSLAVSPDGRRLVSGHCDGSLRAWDLEGWLAAD